jgi:hypothetical protein
MLKFGFEFDESLLRPGAQRQRQLSEIAEKIFSEKKNLGTLVFHSIEEDELMFGTTCLCQLFSQFEKIAQNKFKARRFLFSLFPLSCVAFPTSLALHVLLGVDFELFV